ncbi:MAG: universal stress protein [Leptolyngbyaceae cyanobacterium SM1_3_5]|nr:universal stress protein [Leptolyngbyaceae cyanobacterium SM1_3_5]
MFQKILVAIDASKQGEIVFEQALDLAKATAASLMLLHVLSSEEEGSPNVSMVGLEYYPAVANEIAQMHQKQWEEYENRSLEMLRSRVEQAATAGITAEFTQNFGSPGRTICEVARTWEADLVVVGRRGHSGLNELLLGSVSNYVLHHAPCSVLTVQGIVRLDAAIADNQQAAVVS